MLTTTASQSGSQRSNFVCTLGSRLLASATLASIVVWAGPMWAPAETLVSLVSAHFEGGVDDLPDDAKRLFRDVAIVKINADYFRSSYGSQSPLNRCAMADDLQRLFSLPRMHVVAVDFDLAPYRVPRGDDASCQERLDAALDKFAATRKLILMKPLEREFHSAEVTDLVRKWESARKNVQFAHVGIGTTWGTARTVTPFDGATPALGLAFRHALLADTHLTEGSGPREERQIATRAIEAMHNMGEQISIDEVCSPMGDQQLACANLKAAIVGSGYTPDDRYMTTAGMRDGVDIHAAIAVCPRAGATHLQHFLLDVIVGVFLGWVFNAHWKRYYDTVRGKRLQRWVQARQSSSPLRRFYWWATPRQPDAAYGWLVWMVLSGLALVFATGWVSLLLFQGACSTAIFPIGIFVGMLIEAAIVQGPETAAHLLRHPQDHEPGVPHRCARRKLFSNRHVAFKTAVATLFSLGTFMYLLLH